MTDVLTVIDAGALGFMCGLVICFLLEWLIKGD